MLLSDHDFYVKGPSGHLKASSLSGRRGATDSILFLCFLEEDLPKIIDNIKDFHYMPYSGSIKTHLSTADRSTFMKNNEGFFFEEGKRGGDDLFDFEFDELPEGGPGKAGGGSASEGKIIELVDLVDDSKFNEIEKLLNEEELLDEKTVEEESYFSLDDIDETGEGVSLSFESELDSTPKTLKESENDDIDFSLLESDLRSEQETESLERRSFDFDGSAGSADSSAKELRSTALSRKADRSSGISEERIAAIITRVVQDVVERVARETMTAVAERMTREAVAALKQSLRTPRE